MKSSSTNITTFNVEGMTCNNCAAGIKKHLENNSINDVDVNFSLGEVSFRLEEKNSLNSVIKLIEKLGYKVKKQKTNNKFSKVEILFAISLVFTLPLILHMFLDHSSILYNPIVQLILCLPVYIIGIQYFGKSALKSMKIGVPNMDLLIFIGSSAAFFYSIYGWWYFYGTSDLHNYMFFETSATIITLVLLGNALEHRSVKQTTTALKELTKIQKNTANKIVNDEIVKVYYEDIELGDTLIVNNGDNIPIDGTIIYGECTVDESMITGESIPVSKKINSDVIGGTILTSGSIKISVTKIGKDTVLSQIIDLIKNAQRDQPNIQKLGDKVSAIFVPVVILISLGTFFISHFFYNISTVDAFLRSIAVLVISCPCAMGLATPTAIMVGIGRAAKNGILIKGGITLEKIGKVKNIAFDKTGTITTGNFKIKNINIINGNEDEIKNIIYNLEKHSSHPIAKSIMNELSNYSKDLLLENINETNGIGISATYNGSTFFIGKNTELNDDQKFDVYFKKNNEIIATINLEDEIKEGTLNVFNKLKRNNYKTTLISGDRKEKCENLNDTLSFDEIFSNQLPEDKLKIIEKINRENDTIMIGDGINDAPALSKAFVGISLGNASQIAKQSSEIILLNKDNLRQLPKALQIGKHTLITIKQNLFWAFSYNLIAIPIACMGLLNPMWAALFMAFSDIVVIGNSIRLKFKKIF